MSTKIYIILDIIPKKNVENYVNSLNNSQKLYQVFHIIYMTFMSVLIFIKYPQLLPLEDFFNQIIIIYGFHNDIMSLFHSFKNHKTRSGSEAVKNQSKILMKS